MPTFQLRLADSEFTCCEDVEAADLQAAESQAVVAALGIGAEQIMKGAPFFGAIASVEENGEVKAQIVVAIGSTRLS